MNKQARAARAAEAERALDAALDREIERALAPMRVTAEDVDRFGASGAAGDALPPRRAAALVRSLKRTLGTPPVATSAQSLTLGDLLRQGRQRARLDVTEVARRLHVHRDYLAGVESGTRSPLALGPDGARRLVTLLDIPPGAATAALEAAMRSAIAPTASFSARMKRGVPRETRRRILESALPTEPEKAHAAEWRSLIDAVGELGAERAQRARPPESS